MSRTFEAITSFVAVGDSFTEGLHDDLGADGRHVGWSDRVAAALSSRRAGEFRYANLAVRGKLVDEVVRDQLPVVLEWRPDLVSFHAGGNDLLRPGVAVSDILQRYGDAVGRLRESGSEVLLFTVLERAGGTGRLADRLAARFGRFNDGVRETARTHGAHLADVGRVAALHDRRVWAEDRLHLNPEGHRRVAAAALEAIGVDDAAELPIGTWQTPLPGPTSPSRITTLSADLRWVRRHLLPWVGRRIRGVSSGDEMICKRPELDVLG